MAKVIVNATNKGGDGKTTTSVILSEFLSICKQEKVLLIDLDPQANSSGRYIELEYDPYSSEEGGKRPPVHPEYDAQETDWDGRSTIADIFHGRGVMPYQTRIPTLEVASSYSSKLQNAEQIKKDEVIEKVIERFKQFIDLPDVQSSYDYIIVDTPPSKGPLTKAAFRAATHVIIPAKMEQYSMDGIYGMLQLWKQESYKRSDTNPIKLVGILPNQYRSNNNLHNSLLDSLKSTPGIKEHVIPLELGLRSIYTEILVPNAKPQNIFELPKSHIARLETEKLCNYIYERIK